MVKKSLSRKDWVVAGFQALRLGGPQAVRVESIAKALKVSKGSFYWHFKSVSDLKNAMLDQWVTVATKLVIREVERDLAISDQTLHYLVEISSASLSDSSHEAGMNEASIRDWARYDPDVAKVMKRVDKRRLEFVAIGFERAGFDSTTSKENAKTLYASLIGLDHLNTHGLAEIQEDLPRVLSELLKSTINSSSSPANGNFSTKDKG